MHGNEDGTISEKLDLLTQKLELFMTKAQEQFDALMARLDTVTNDIAADYQKLLDEIQNNTVSPESIAAANANIAKLEALGASVENPVPENPDGGTGETGETGEAGGPTPTPQA